MPNPPYFYSNPLIFIFFKTYLLMNQTKKRDTWFEKQKLRKKNPFFRLLNRSFSFRLLIASAISLGILGAVHRFETCHAKKYSSDCLAANFGDIISVSNVESFSIVAAAWLYILEGSKRKQQKNLDAKRNPYL
jgi:hypothetical protein